VRTASVLVPRQRLATSDHDDRDPLGSAAGRGARLRTIYARTMTTFASVAWIVVTREYMYLLAINDPQVMCWRVVLWVEPFEFLAMPEPLKQCEGG